MIRVPSQRSPTHPGQILLEDYLTPLGMSQRQLADAIRVPFQRVNEIINGRRGVTPSTALRLERLFGVSAGFWLNLQSRWDLHHAQQQEAATLAEIRPLTLPTRSDAPRTMAAVYRKTSISQQGSDLEYWLSQPPAVRLAAVEEIRREYHAWRYGAEPRFQRVLTILKRQ